MVIADEGVGFNGRGGVAVGVRVSVCAGASWQLLRKRVDKESFGWISLYWL